MSSPIVLVTGAPGSGKTLWTIPEVEKLRTDTGRPAYYWRIPELTLGWTELLDAKTWHELETGSIVVIDEAHKVFPQRPAGSQPPAHVAPFDELRHRGHTVFLITQHPGELDHYIRRRVGRHIHLERRFGLARSRRIEWQRLAEDLTDRRDAISSEFRFNPSTYGLYKSADVHTVTAKPPWGKFAGIAGAALVSLCAFIYAMSFFSKPEKTSEHSTTEATPISTAAAPALSDPKAEAAQWSQKFVSRIDSLPYSAQLYDTTAFAPVTFPKISGCMEIQIGYKVKCTCTTQQGTIIPMTVPECRYWRAHGWFDWTKPDEDNERDEDYATTTATTTAPASPSPSAGGAPRAPGEGASFSALTEY